MFYIKSIFVCLILFAFSTKGLNAQELLTKDAAIETTLSNNYGIALARKNIEIAKNNTDKKANGYLPTVDASAAGSLDFGGSGQSFSTGQEVSTSNALTLGANASINANYALINKTRDYTLEQLKEELNLSNLELRSIMEDNVFQVLTAYYQIAQLTSNQEVLKEAMAVSRRRLLRKQYQFELGQGNKLDVLNAEVDIQRDTINIINSAQLIANAKRNLNAILNRDIDLAFEVDTTVVYNPLLSLEQITTDAKQNNVNLAILKKNTEITNYNFDIIESSKKPTLNATGSYGVNIQDNPDESFITKSNTRGLSLGLNASWNLFDGGRREIQKQNNQVALEIQSIQKLQIEQQLERDVANTWYNYQNALLVLQVEQANLATNRVNFERTEERFKAGQISSIEFRQAQLNLMNAATSYNSARYDAVLFELDLRRLSGSLLD